MPESLPQKPPKSLLFSPIGKTNFYYGSAFNGGGHAISGLNIEVTSEGYGGLFGNVGDVEIKDLTIGEGSIKSTTGYIGALVGYMSGSCTISNVHIRDYAVNSPISYGVGGFVGQIWTNDETDRCDFVGCTAENTNIVGYANVGGFWGTSTGSEGKIGIYNCALTGTVQAINVNGAICGGYGASAPVEIIGLDVSGLNASVKGVPTENLVAYTETEANTQEKATPDFVAVPSVSVDGEWTAQTAAVSLNKIPYISLDAALTVAKNGDEIVLKQRYEGPSIEVGKAITINLSATNTEESLFRPAANVVKSYSAVDGKISFALKTYSVSFDVNGGSEIAAKEVVHGESVDKPADPVRSGYKFAGWYADRECTIAYDFNGAVTENIVLYAKWEPVSSSGGSTVPSEPEGEVTENEDGSTTTTVTEDDGSKTETTVSEDEGVTTVVEKDKDGAVTSVSATVTEEAVEAAAGKAVALPFAEPIEAASSEKAVEIEVQAPAGAKVAVPVAKAEGSESVAPGAVLVLVDAEGNETVLPKTANDGSSLSAQIPGDCTLKVVDASASFPDVASDDWYEEQGVADFISARGVMTGVEVAPGSFEFQGDVATNRGMFVTMLHRLESEPAAESEGFADVPEGSWYEDSSAWAVEAGIATGYLDAEGDAAFDGEGFVTREQMATFLFRYAQWLGLDTSARAEGEVEGVSDFAEEAVSWAVAEGLIKGDDTTGAIRPGDGATRAEAAVVIMRMIGLMA